jgi:outer membrane protein TolC
MWELVAGLLVLGAGRAVAADPTPMTLSLAGAVSLALEQNPSLAAVREDLPAARARLRMAQSASRLTASANIFLSAGTMSETLAGPGQVMPQMTMAAPNRPRADQALMLMYPLSTGGRVRAQVAAADARVRAAQADLDAQVLDVAYAVRAAYRKALLTQELARVQEENLKEQQERLRVDQAASDAGKVPPYYVLRDKAEVAAASRELTNARRDAAMALLDLRTAIGLSPSAPLQLTEALQYDPTAADAEAGPLIEEALQNRPEARSLRSAGEAAAHEVAARRAAYRFQVDGAVMLEGEKVSGMAAQAGYLAGVVASLPVLDGGSRRANVAEAEAMQRRVAQEQKALALEIERQVRAALLQVQAANENVRAASEGVAAAEEDHRVALVRYQAGKAINLEPISALAALVLARTNHAQALFDLSVAVDSLQRAVGRATPLH